MEDISSKSRLTATLLVVFLGVFGAVLVKFEPNRIRLLTKLC